MIEVEDLEDCPPLSSKDEELLEVDTRVVAKLNTDWLDEKQEACSKILFTTCSVMGFWCCIRVLFLKVFTQR